MRHLENTVNDPFTPEHSVIQKKWQGRVFENQEWGCYEAVFVIELRGVSVGIGSPVLPDNPPVNRFPTLPLFKEPSQ